MCLSGAALLNPGAQEDPLKLPSTRWHCLRRQARQRDWGKGSADNIRANGRHDPHQQAEDMTAPTIKRNAAKKPLISGRRPDMTTPELSAELAAASGTKAVPPHSRAGSSATATASKKTLLASEQDRPDVKEAREEWTTTRQPRMRLETHRLVFLDETGTTTKMTRLRGRCPKGRRLRCKAPFGHWMTQTFVAGLRCDKLTAPFVVNAPMNRRIFGTYVKTQLAPALDNRRCRHHGQFGRPQEPG